MMCTLISRAKIRMHQSTYRTTRDLNRMVGKFGVHIPVAVCVFLRSLRHDMRWMKRNQFRRLSSSCESKRKLKNFDVNNALKIFLFFSSKRNLLSSYSLHGAHKKKFLTLIHRTFESIFLIMLFVPMHHTPAAEQSMPTYWIWCIDLVSTTLLIFVSLFSSFSSNILCRLSQNWNIVNEVRKIPMKINVMQFLPWRKLLNANRHSNYFWPRFAWVPTLSLSLSFTFSRMANNLSMHNVCSVCLWCHA